jgi:uncharacterized protein (TIGR01777 family)
MIEIALTLLVAQSVLGAFDTIYHHEIKVGLARSANAAPELRVHAIRSVLYALVFLGLAWRVFSGWWVVALVAVVLTEVVLTLWDFAIEDETRLLPRSERILHTLLAINGGAAFLLVALELPAWFAQPTALEPAAYGWKSIALTIAAAGVALSGVRDAFAAWNVNRLALDLDLDFGAPHLRFLVTGGTGFLGGSLCRELVRAGHEVTIVSRRPAAAAMQFGGAVRAVNSTAELSDHEIFDAIVNLAGAPVIGMPWSAKRRREILESRLGATADLLGFARRAVVRPRVWLQSSAVGYYGPTSSQVLDESAGAGAGFAARMCRQWEAAAEPVAVLGVRCVVLRMGLVFGRGGGALPALLTAFRVGAGAVLGSGTQRVAWIHVEDWLRLVARTVSDAKLAGAINAVAPAAPAYRDFARAMARAVQRPLWLRIPGRVLSCVVGEMATLFVEGPPVAALRLGEIGFDYRFPDIESALMDLS